MGIVRMGPPKELLLRLRSKYGLRDFVETGTYYGETADWAASHFDHVTTIEYSRPIYEETTARLHQKRNINFIFGDSRTELKTIIPKLSRPTIFWLDSHWSSGDTYGKNDECPLIEEIRIINTSETPHFLFIDDARLFTSPPPRPHRMEQWPSIDEVIEALKSGNHEIYIVLFEDVIIAVPQYAKETVANYCQKENTRKWRERGKRPQRAKKSEFKRGYRLIAQGVKLAGRGVLAQLKRLISAL
jgi:hypothetical protein